MGGVGGGRLFEGGRLLTFSAFRMGAYSKWALIRGWAVIRINTVGAHTTPKFLLRDRRGAASAFRDRNRAAIRYDFRGGAKAIRYSAGAGSFCLR